MIEVAETISPCILWIDEIDKALVITLAQEIVGLVTVY